MKISGSIALVTGANRGLGAAFARGLLAAGATKVYAAARDPSSVTLDGVVPVQLDVTQPEHVATLARELTDVTLLVNNAGISERALLLDPSSVESLYRQFETNTIGPLRLMQAFAPVLANNGGGAIINILSVLSWVTLPTTGSYSASKAGMWALGNALRQELKAQHTELLAVHSALIDTDMTHGVPGEKLAPADVVQQALAALEAGQPEMLADPTTRAVRAGLSAQPPVYIGADA
ncbi:MAG TPA: SDR family oxidoreductase [Paraburkholderia sp.]|uniref:SDR family oxidoreductase n=1 Tax=Paraburkholderia sp. TaxID=1926495 RepID=UPI002B47C4AD|nr:SDR family oxidoreductase [Paraburkholderia sp.]HKR38612.1 SDR family oxidoreductase [Paraburkholderia sp.]